MSPPWKLDYFGSAAATNSAFNRCANCLREPRLTRPIRYRGNSANQPRTKSTYSEQERLRRDRLWLQNMAIEEAEKYGEKPG
jgi:hypothetical protein